MKELPPSDLLHIVLRPGEAAVVIREVGEDVRLEVLYPGKKEGHTSDDAFATSIAAGVAAEAFGHIDDMMQKMMVELRVVGEDEQ